LSAGACMWVRPGTGTEWWGIPRRTSIAIAPAVGLCGGRHNRIKRVSHLRGIFRQRIGSECSPIQLRCPAVSPHSCRPAYVPVHKLYKENCLLKNNFSYCVCSPTSPFFLLLSEHKHYDNAATNSNSEKYTSRIVASLRGRVDTGRKKISPELDAFVLLVSTRIRLVFFWHAL